MGFAKMAVGGTACKLVCVALCGFVCGGFSHGFLALRSPQDGHGMPCPYDCAWRLVGARYIVPFPSECTQAVDGRSLGGGSAVFGLRRREQALRILRWGQSFSRKKISPSRGLL